MSDVRCHRCNDTGTITSQGIAETCDAPAHECTCFPCKYGCGRDGNPAHNNACCPMCYVTGGRVHTEECVLLGFDDGCKPKPLKSWQIMLTEESIKHDTEYPSCGPDIVRDPARRGDLCGRCKHIRDVHECECYEQMPDGSLCPCEHFMEPPNPKSIQINDFYTLDDYLKALENEGPLAYDWSDKPHRLIYDLANYIRNKM